MWTAGQTFTAVLQGAPVTAFPSGYTYFESCIRSALDALSGLSGRVCRMSIKHDSAMHRLVLTAGFSAAGIRRIERSST